jgi:hypothetical protein
MAETRRELRGVLPGDDFHALRDLHFQWNDLAEMHTPEDGEAKKK